MLQSWSLVVLQYVPSVGVHDQVLDSASLLVRLQLVLRLSPVELPHDDLVGAQPEERDSHGCCDHL